MPKGRPKTQRDKVPATADLTRADLDLGRDLQGFLCRIPSNRWTPEEAANLRDEQMRTVVDRYLAEHRQWLQRWLELWTGTGEGEGGKPRKPAAHLN